MTTGLGMVIIGITGLVSVAIAVICVRWMKSTRASQRRVDEQNERIIALLERIAGQRPDDRS